MCSRISGQTKVWGCPTSEKEESSAIAPSSSDDDNDNGAPLRMLEIFNLMTPQFISFQILLALNKSSYNGLSCHGLNFYEDQDGGTDENKTSSEETASSYVRHLKILIHSRKWLRLEFHRCRGVESLLWMPPKADNDGDEGTDSDDGTVGKTEKVSSTSDSQPTKVPVSTKVDFLLLKFPRSRSHIVDSYNAKVHEDFFANLWDHWKVRKLSLSMNFSTEWTKEFSRRKVSSLEDLEIEPDCTWHKREKKSVGENDANGEDNDEDIFEGIDCWELFCRGLKINHPQLRCLKIDCKILDDDLA